MSTGATGLGSPGVEGGQNEDGSHAGQDDKARHDIPRVKQVMDRQVTVNVLTICREGRVLGCIWTSTSGC